MPRRMFSPQIIDSDAFLDMPNSAQSLYFHLGMRADDDGFVGNPKKVLRMIGGNDDDLKILLGKRFLLTFESGVIVIKHWRINNLVRKDWYKETVYLEEKKSLIVKDNGSYSEVVNEPLTKPPRRLGKVRLGKDINTIVALPPKSSFTGIQSFLDSPQKHIRLIGFFFQKKQIEYTTPEEWTQAAKRWMKTAAAVSKFETDKINKAFEKAQEWNEWTLETVYKKLTGQNANT